MNDHVDPFEIARRLFIFAGRVQTDELEVLNLPKSESEQEVFRQEFGVEERYAGPAQEMIERLQGALDDRHWDADVSEIPRSKRDQWTFGTAITFRGTPKPILRGFLQPLQREPLIRRLPDRVALFLITLDGGEDYLDRESHGMGKHYHYLNWREERSNVILCWDTRWQAPDPQTRPPTLRALFVESHGEKSNADFVARPELWGVRKRASMHAACLPDLVKWPIEEFRCAANKSEIVHPLGRKLTPHPTAVAAGVAKAARRGFKKRRR